MVESRLQIDGPGYRQIVVQTMRCSNCHSKDISYSKLKWWEAPLLLFLVYPYRCASCRRRLYRPLWFTPTTDLRQSRSDPEWQYGKQIHYRSNPAKPAAGTKSAT